MRLSLWIGLIFAFSVGMCCAFAIRSLHFEAKPEVVQVRTAEPTTKILVATKTIPRGVEITADFVAFQDFPISEVPKGALSDFNKVYRRQPAFPIPIGCSICEDLLLPQTEAVIEATFIPPGSQFVTLDIVHLRQGDMIFSPSEPLETMLAPKQRIDIRIVPQDGTPGRLTQLKNQALQAFSADDFRNSGELILENVPIHQIQRRSLAEHAGTPRDSLVLVLDKSEADKLTTAAKKGQIRVLAHRGGQAVPEPIEIESVFEIAQRPAAYSEPSPFEPPVPAEVPPVAVPPVQEQPEPSVIPLVQEQLEQPQPGLTEVTPVASMEGVRTITTELTNISAPELPSTSVPVHIVVPAPVADSIQVPVVRIPQSLEQRSQNSVVSALPVLDEGEILIRNEVSKISNGVPSQRILSAMQPAVQNSAVQKSPVQAASSASTSEEKFPTRSTSEIVMQKPRTQSIQFVTPNNAGNAAQAQNTARQSESAAASRGASFVAVSQATPPAATPLPLVLPLVAPSAPMPQDRGGMQGYSPFERRAYTVQPSEHSEVRSNGDLLAPPLLKTSMP